MRNSFPPFLAALLLVTLSACSEDTTGSDTGEPGILSGVVVDSLTGDPIAGARVSTIPESSSTTTVANGEYTLDDIDAGTYTVVVQKSMYLTRETIAQVNSGQTTTVNVALGPDGGFVPLDSLIQVLRFDGEDDYLLIADTNPSDLSDENFTIELWCRPNRLNTTASNGEENQWNFLIGHGQNDIDLDYLLGFEDRKPTFQVRRTASGVVGETTVSTDTWYHCAVVQDIAASEVRIYINGELDSKSSLQGAPQLTAADIYVGAREDNGTGEGTGFFDGEIFELRMWNVVRSKLDIEEFRWKILSGTESGLVGYWPMTNGSGAVIAEKTGRNITGTIEGPIWLTVRNPMYR